MFSFFKIVDLLEQITSSAAASINPVESFGKKQVYEEVPPPFGVGLPVYQVAPVRKKKPTVKLKGRRYTKRAISARIAARKRRR